MPYKSNADLPEAVRSALPSAAQSIFRAAYNSHAADNPEADESECAAIAWAAVKKSFVKKGDTWVAKDAAISLTMADSYAAENLILDAVPKRTGDGYLTAVAKVARTGIQLYKGAEIGRPDVPQVRVYRPADEVFDKASLRSIAHKPITLDHPSDPVNSKNWKRLGRGTMGGEVMRDGDYVAVPLLLMDEDVINPVERKDVRELSLGYTMDLTFEDGVSDKGEPYDAVMRNIRVNHLAIVPKARGGGELKIGDNDGDRVMANKTFMCDRVSVTMETRDAEIVEKAISDRDTVVADLKAKLESSTATASTAKAASDVKIAELTTAISTKDGEIVVLKKQVTDSAVTPEKLTSLARERSLLIAKAATLLGDKYDYAKKLDPEIRRDAVAKYLGDAETAKAMDDATITGAFLAATKDAKISPTDGSTVLANLLTVAGTTAADGDPRNKAIAEGNQSLSDAWKTGGNAPPPGAQH